jgi:hypothetical protein
VLVRKCEETDPSAWEHVQKPLSLLPAVITGECALSKGRDSYEMTKELAGHCWVLYAAQLRPLLLH